MCLVQPVANFILPTGSPDSVWEHKPFKGYFDTSIAIDGHFQTSFFDE